MPLSGPDCHEDERALAVEEPVAIRFVSRQTKLCLYSGTPSVVASLWKVEDNSTAALIASFYKNLKTMSKVEALRQAQLQLIRGEARSDLLARRGIGGVGKLGEVPAPNSQSPTPNSISTSHPYFWAPFILVGDGK